MKPNIDIKRNHSFAFEVIIQIIRLKLESNQNVDTEVKDLLRVISFNQILETQNPDKLTVEIPKLVLAIQNQMYPGIKIFDRFDPIELSYKLSVVLETFFKFYPAFPHNPGDSHELRFLQNLYTRIFNESSVRINANLSEPIKEYQRKLKEDKIEKLGRLFTRVNVAFRGHECINSETDLEIITGIIAMHLGFGNTKKLEDAIQTNTVYEFFRALMKGAVQNVYRKKWINSDIKMSRSDKKSN